jgi:hypothetical protein
MFRDCIEYLPSPWPSPWKEEGKNLCFIIQGKSHWIKGRAGEKAGIGLRK